MEITTKRAEKVGKPTLYFKTIEKLLSKLKKGRLHVEYPDHSTQIFGEDDSIVAHVKIHSYNFFRRCFYYGDIGFGEAYMAKEWSTDNITDVIRWMILNLENLEGASGGKKSSFNFNINQATFPVLS